MGAGDAFCAGILYGAEMEMNLAEALKLGVCTAAASLSAVGATEGVGSLKEVRALYEQYRPNRL